VNIRIVLGYIGVAVALLAGSLLGLGLTNAAIQISLACGASMAIIATGIEHFYENSPMLDRFTSRRTKATIGCVFIMVGTGLLALVVGNLLTRGVH